jgi:hypothetical protein
MLVLGMGVTYSFHHGYRRVGEIAQGIYDEILKDTLPKKSAH